ncbi:MAG: DNA-3-methyladenine glycosylase family protein, partial [Steroidobacteraceae bacterium]
RRVIRAHGRSVLIEVSDRGTIDAPSVRLSLPGDSLPAQLQKDVARTTRGILGLDQQSAPHQSRAEAEPALRATALALRGMRPPRYPDLFETFANVIPFQQLSLQAGMAVVAQLVQRFGEMLQVGGRRHFVFPRAEAVAGERISSLRRTGMSRHKSESLRAAARAIASGTLTTESIAALPSPEAIDRLRELPGIGPWSAALILLRGFRRLDVFPPTDTGAESSLVALMRLRSPDALGRVVERFGDCRGYLYFYGLASRLLAAGLIHPAAAPDAARLHAG